MLCGWNFRALDNGANQIKAIDKGDNYFGS